MAEFANPFRPGAGHTPPYLAGRQAERAEFQRLLSQTTILENMVMTGLRGVGKTVLLDSFRPLAIERGWIWVGTDLSESTSVSEDNMAIRLCTDLSPITSSVVVETETVQHTLGYQALMRPVSPHPGAGAGQDQGSPGACLGCPVEGVAGQGNHLRLRRGAEPVGSIGQGAVPAVAAARLLSVSAERRGSP